MVNEGTSDLLLHIVQCWRACAVDAENWALQMVLYCSHMMYKYYSRILLSSIKQSKEGKYIYNKIFNNIPHIFQKPSAC